MALMTRFGALTGLVAAASMAATPAFAADMPTEMVILPAQGGAVFAEFDTTTYDSDADIAQRHRGWGWRRGWRRHRRGVRAGDVLAGVLILGGIAAVASAASNNRRRERDVVIVERDRDRDRYRYEDRRRDDRRDNRRSSGASGLENAVSQCVDRIEQDIRVDSVDSVDRTGEGWLVTGSLFNGSGFTCRIGNDGRIADIDYGGFAARNEFRESEAGENRFVRETRAEGQLDDRTYLAARGNVASQPQSRPSDRSTERPTEPLVPLTAETQPAYPGGPLPGEEQSETLARVDGDLSN